ncbi:hypothetical protein Aph01nite_31420 [Acrocarpospora phusangensis]|uniref:Uncharacterized protein n=1 Tax=Acrocarpospora phusangensis TaxID=1070424 RepID=A0A919Q9J0_9ACTN|nr:hypothetical protein Aph01nite_31420 [Acrocarpospora phusangensis]
MEASSTLSGKSNEPTVTAAGAEPPELAGGADGVAWLSGSDPPPHADKANTAATAVRMRRFIKDPFTIGR